MTTRTEIIDTKDQTPPEAKTDGNLNFAEIFSNVWTKDYQSNYPEINTQDSKISQSNTVLAPFLAASAMLGAGLILARGRRGNNAGLNELSLAPEQALLARSAELPSLISAQSKKLADNFDSIASKLIESQPQFSSSGELQYAIGGSLGLRLLSAQVLRQGPDLRLQEFTLSNTGRLNEVGHIKLSPQAEEALAGSLAKIGDIDTINTRQIDQTAIDAILNHPLEILKLEPELMQSVKPIAHTDGKTVIVETSSYDGRIKFLALPVGDRQIIIANPADTLGYKLSASFDQIGDLGLYTHKDPLKIIRDFDNQFTLATSMRTNEEIVEQSRAALFRMRDLDKSDLQIPYHSQFFSNRMQALTSEIIRSDPNAGLLTGLELDRAYHLSFLHAANKLNSEVDKIALKDTANSLKSLIERWQVNTDSPVTRQAVATEIRLRRPELHDSAASFLNNPLERNTGFAEWRIREIANTLPSHTIEQHLTSTSVMRLLSEINPSQASYELGSLRTLLSKGASPEEIRNILTNEFSQIPANRRFVLDNLTKLQEHFSSEEDFNRFLGHVKHFTSSNYSDDMAEIQKAAEKLFQPPKY